MNPDDPILAALKMRWAAVALSGSILLAVFWAGIGQHLGVDEAVRWLPFALFAAGTVLGLLYRQLAENSTPDGKLLDTLGPPNLITVYRGFLVAFAAGFIFVPQDRLMANQAFSWAPGTAYVIALLMDLADGGLARRSGRTTELGRRLDTQVDGLAVLCGSLLAVMWHKAPLWFVLVGMAYYLFCSGCRLQAYFLKPCRILPGSRIRRLLAGTMMVTIGVILFPPVSSDLSRMLTSVVAVPFLVNFLKDWFAVSHVKPSLSKNA